MLTVGNYNSQTHANNKDYTDTVFHIDVICFTVSCLEEVYDAIHCYDFGKPVTWQKNGISYAEISRYFGNKRNKGETGSINIEIGYMFKDHVAEKFVVLYQIPNESD